MIGAQFCVEHPTCLQIDKMDFAAGATGHGVTTGIIVLDVGFNPVVNLTRFVWTDKRDDFHAVITPYYDAISFWNDREANVLQPSLFRR